MHHRATLLFKRCIYNFEPYSNYVQQLFLTPSRSSACWCIQNKENLFTFPHPAGRAAEARQWGGFWLSLSLSSLVQRSPPLPHTHRHTHTYAKQAYRLKIGPLCEQSGAEGCEMRKPQSKGECRRTLVIGPWESAAKYLLLVLCTFFSSITMLIICQLCMQMRQGILGGASALSWSLSQGKHFSPTDPRHKTTQIHRYCL